jgi:hypothetical protein
MASDDLSRRRQRASLQLSYMGVHLQWSPHWELQVRLSGRWWFFWMALPVLTILAACCAIWLIDLARWIAGDERRLYALSGAIVVALATLAWRWRTRATRSPD